MSLRVKLRCVIKARLKIRPPGRESGFTFSLPIPFHLAYSPTLIGPQKTVPDSTDKRKTVRNWFLWDQELERMARWKEIESWDGDYYYALSTLNLYWCAQWKEKLRRTHKDWGWTAHNVNRRLMDPHSRVLRLKKREKRSGLALICNRGQNSNQRFAIRNRNKILSTTN